MRSPGMEVEVKYFHVLGFLELGVCHEAKIFVSFYFDLATLVAVIGRFTNTFSRSHLHFRF